MGLGFAEFFDSLILIYRSLLSASESYPVVVSLINVCLLSIFIVVLILFVWGFCGSLSKKDILKLNLYKYNISDFSFARKLLAVLFYVFEYLIVMPFLIILWGILLSTFILLSSEAEVNYVAMLTVSMITAIRILAYYKEDISAEVAKLFPFWTIGALLLSPNLFNFTEITKKIEIIPNLIGDLFYYFLFILLIELFLRISSSLIESFSD